jgi:uncharacterized protein (DUF608 family)
MVQGGFVHSPLGFCPASLTGESPVAGVRTTLSSPDRSKIHMAHQWNREYTGDNLNKMAFPLGGIGAGMICLEGNGSLSHVSVRHRPEVFNQPFMFGAVSVKGQDGWTARVLQGRTPDWKVMFPFGGRHGDSGNGGNKPFGLPYFRQCRFRSEFPFATVELADDDIPLKASLTGWSPFTPGQADDSSLPLAVLEYTLENTSAEAVESVFTFASKHFMQSPLEKSSCCGGSGCDSPAPDHRILQTENGFVLSQPRGQGPAQRQGDFAIAALEPAHVNCRWFRGEWFDSQSILWNQLANGEAPEAVPYTEGGCGDGASLSVPFTLKPGQPRTIRLLLAWYVPFSDLIIGSQPQQPTPEDCYRPWYARNFGGVEAVLESARSRLDHLRKESEIFAGRLAGCGLPPEALEAVSANLTILKSPTILRQHDGRLWAWEGCADGVGCCHGSCTHVWNYAQALPHLFPDLERSLRHSEFHENQDERGHQDFRAWLPIRPITGHNGHAAADGQLGAIMRVHRDWQISGDDRWLEELWPRVKQSLDYCIATWDPQRVGMLVEPHHNTYDIEFWGPDGMCTSFYLGALKAASVLAAASGEDGRHYQLLYEKGRRAMETELWNGEYFIQKVQTEGLRSPPPEATNALVGGNIYSSPEAKALLAKEGPKYQYGNGCLSDGVLGAWMAEVCGIGEILDPAKVKSHLLSVHKYNFRTSLHNHANPQRPTYALNDEAGLLLCTWPRGDRPSLPFVYSEEVWTGIEYQVASHLAMMGEPDKCLEIVRAVRSRYDGRVRNPCNEYECGHWYARAMSSYALLQAFGAKL